MSKFNYMKYHCNKVIEDAEQKAIHERNFHELHPIFPDNEIVDETVSTFKKYIADNFECVNADYEDSIDDLAIFIASIVGKYLDVRSIAGFELHLGNNASKTQSYFDNVHGKFLLDIPESYEYEEDLDNE